MAEQHDDNTRSVRLSDGRTVTLREPMTGELRGIKLLEVLQMDPAAHAELIPRISELEKPAFYKLRSADMMRIITEVVGFFAPEAMETDAYPSGSKTPGK